MRRQILMAALVIAAAAIPAAADDRRGNPRKSDHGYERDNRGYSRDDRDDNCDDDHGRDGNRGYSYGRNNDNGSYGRQYRGGDPVTAAIRELEYVFRRARVDNHEANHFRSAMHALAEFDQRASRGQFDRGNLDRAIGDMADLAQARQLNRRDRQLIGRRLQDLRYYRERGARR